MKLFDLHCDTLLGLHYRKEKIDDNDLHISFKKAFSAFDEYTQVMALYSVNKLDDDLLYKKFDEVLDACEGTLKHDGFKYILAVEGAKLLGGDIERLYHLKERGVKILTLVWGGECCIGGAHDTDTGLTDFGKEVVSTCFDIGIIPDLSHASDRLFFDTVDIAAKKNGTLMASHSCSRAICPHKRNLTDDMARIIAELGGIVGVNLVTEHLGGNTVGRVAEHIYHFADIMGEDRVCLGCDLDGTDELPIGISDISGLPLIHDELCKSEYGKGIADMVFYSNAQSFFKNRILW